MQLFFKCSGRPSLKTFWGCVLCCHFVVAAVVVLCIKKLSVQVRGECIVLLPYQGAQPWYILYKVY
jgi:uncharacterized membrane protein YhaH (DUF805 family)